MKSQILKFKDMPFEFQRSILLDNLEGSDTNWTDLGQVDWVKDIDKVQIWINDFSKVYADMEFRFGIISIEDVIEKIMPTIRAENLFDNFKEYHKWVYDGTNHGESVFPIIISEFEDIDGLVEYIKDGWHRFHSYVNKGLKKIPFVEYI